MTIQSFVWYYVVKIGDSVTDDLKKMFDEQNAKILKNKLILDIDNNTDSLNLTLSNVIMLEMSKLIKNITKYCHDSDIKLQEEQLHKLIDKEKEELKKNIDEELKVRSDELKKNLVDNDNGSECLGALNEQMIDNVNTNVSKQMAIDFLPNLIRSIEMNNENDLTRINELVRLTSNTIQNRITNNSRTRFTNLINMLGESRSTSLKMMEKTDKALEKLENNENIKKERKNNKKKLKKVA